MKYDWICANFPRKIPFVKDDIKRLVCSMALGYQRSEVPEASVECANDAIDIDPNYSKVCILLHITVYFCIPLYTFVYSL